jgi:hypothetical protein
VPPQVITRDEQVTAPLEIPLGAADAFEPLAAFASFDGSAASGAFLPCITYYTQDGKVFARAFPATDVAAGASADVSWFPGLSQSPATAGSGGGGNPLQVYLDTPDSSGNAVPGLSTLAGFSNVRRILPYLSHSGDGYWIGAVRVPDDYGSAPVVTVSGVVNATTGAVRLVVGTAADAAGGSADAALVDEAAVNVPVPGVALERFDQAFAVTGSSPAAGKVLVVRVKRNAANAGDTCTAAFGVWAVTFGYTAA